MLEAELGQEENCGRTKKAKKPGPNTKAGAVGGGEGWSHVRHGQWQRQVPQRGPPKDEGQEGGSAGTTDACERHHKKARVSVFDSAEGEDPFIQLEQELDKDSFGDSRGGSSYIDDGHAEGSKMGLGESDAQAPDDGTAGSRWRDGLARTQNGSSFEEEEEGVPFVHDQWECYPQDDGDGCRDSEGAHHPGEGSLAFQLTLDKDGPPDEVERAEVGAASRAVEGGNLFADHEALYGWLQKVSRNEAKEIQ